jgi:hypothetical protein
VERTNRRLLQAKSVQDTHLVCIRPCCHTTVKVMTFLTMPLDPKTAQPALQLEIMQRTKVSRDGGGGGSSGAVNSLVGMGNADRHQGLCCWAGQEQCH